jgi:hypothetical protein
MARPRAGRRDRSRLPPPGAGRPLRLSCAIVEASSALAHVPEHRGVEHAPGGGHLRSCSTIRRLESRDFTAPVADVTEDAGRPAAPGQVAEVRARHRVTAGRQAVGVHQAEHAGNLGALVLVTTTGPSLGMAILVGLERSRLRRALIAWPATSGNGQASLILGCIWGAGCRRRRARGSSSSPVLAQVITSWSSL